MSSASIAVALQQAHALMAQGQFESAEALCRRMLEAAPGEPDAVQLLGLIRRRRGDLAGAESLLRRSIQMAPGRPQYHANLGNLLAAAGRPAEAESSYRNALRLDPGFRPARLGVIRVLSGSGQTGAAESEARALLVESPRDAETWHELGLALRRQQRLAEAESAYRRALEIQPGFALARHNLGALLTQMARSQEALDELARASDAGLRGREIHVNRARALTELNRHDEALAELGHARAHAPQDVETLVTIAKIRFMRDEADFARELRAVAEQNPGSATLAAAHATVLREGGRVEESLAAFRSAIASLGPDPALLSGLALSLQTAGRPEEAVDPAREAARASPGSLAAANTFHTILLSLGRAGEALPLIRATRARAPLAQEPIALEAVAARALGDPAYPALYDYERFVRPYDLQPPAGFASMDEFNSELLEILNARHRLQARPLDQSLRFGTQTTSSLLRDPDPRIRAFFEMLVAPIADYRAALESDPGHPLLARNQGTVGFAGCWSVRLGCGGYHVNHIHPQGWLSSAYYVHTPADVDDVAAQSGWIKFGEPFFPAPGVLPERIIQPRPGRLVLFPSYMWHGTTPITTDEPRVTIAFDIITHGARANPRSA